MDPFDVVLYAHAGPIVNKPHAVNMPEESVAPFLKNNIAVAFPMRQGRGGSDGETSLPWCIFKQVLASVEEGVGDTEVGLDYVKRSPLFKGGKIYATGVSQGGMIAAILAVRHPNVISKAVAFAPGWIATEGNQVCKTFPQALQNNLFERLAKANAAPTLFLHANNDSYHPPASVAESFNRYKARGGTGVMKIYPDTRTFYNDGHFLIKRPDIWEDDVLAFLGIKKQAAPEVLNAPQK